MAKQVVGSLLDEFSDWDSASVHTLRLYGLSCARLAELRIEPGGDTSELHREVRTNLSLLKALDLGVGR